MSVCVFKTYPSATRISHDSSWLSDGMTTPEVIAVLKDLRGKFNFFDCPEWNNQIMIIHKLVEFGLVEIDSVLVRYALEEKWRPMQKSLVEVIRGEHVKANIGRSPDSRFASRVADIYKKLGPIALGTEQESSGVKAIVGLLFAPLLVVLSVLTYIGRGLTSANPLWWVLKKVLLIAALLVVCFVAVKGVTRVMRMGAEWNAPKTFREVDFDKLKAEIKELSVKLDEKMEGMSTKIDGKLTELDVKHKFITSIIIMVRDGFNGNMTELEVLKVKLHDTLINHTRESDLRIKQSIEEGQASLLKVVVEVQHELALATSGFKSASDRLMVDFTSKAASTLTAAITKAQDDGMTLANSAVKGLDRMLLELNTRNQAAVEANAKIEADIAAHGVLQAGLKQNLSETKDALGKLKHETKLLEERNKKIMPLVEKLLYLADFFKSPHGIFAVFVFGLFLLFLLIDLVFRMVCTRFFEVKNYEVLLRKLTKRILKLEGSVVGDHRTFMDVVFMGSCMLFAIVIYYCFLTPFMMASIATAKAASSVVEGTAFVWNATMHAPGSLMYGAVNLGSDLSNATGAFIRTML